MYFSNSSLVDTFVSMPTGSGKSVCFASTPIVFDKLKGYYTDHSPSPGLCTHHCITVVVSPLTALMQDQVSKFQSKGLKAACVGGEEKKGFDGVINVTRYGKTDHSRSNIILQ